MANNRIRGFFQSLVSDEFLLGDEQSQRMTNLTLTAGSVILVSSVLFIICLIKEEYLQVGGAGATVLLNAVTLFILHRSKRQKLAMYVFSVGMLLAAWFLLLFGSSRLYSTTWILSYPIIFCLFFGNSFARPYLTMLLASMLLIFSPLFDAWRVVAYPQEFYTQLPLMFVAFSLLCMFGEYVRHSTSRRLLYMFKHYYESANRDQLTGLLNRRAFYEMISREQARSRRHHLGLQLVMCDIDHFKLINDRFGHQCGDLYLRHVACLLLGKLRGDDYCFRWGGEEFLLLLPNTSPPQALLVAHRLLNTIRETPLQGSGCGEISTTMSFGVHAFDLSLSADENIALTDERLYQAKKNGRNRVEQTPVALDS